MTKNPFHAASRPLPSPRLTRVSAGEAAYLRSDKGRIETALMRPYSEPRPFKPADLRKIREGIGLSAQYAAALAGITDMTLLTCEERQDDVEMVQEILAVYALYMATTWAADLVDLRAIDD